VSEYHPLGLVLHMQEYFAYVDVEKKEFDFSDAVSRIRRDSDPPEEGDERRKLLKRVEDFWDHLGRRNQAIFCRDGLVKYEAILVIDDKGDVWHKFPHIYADFDARTGPFAGVFEYVKIGRGQIGADRSYGIAEWKRIKVFPDVFPEAKIGKVHLDRVLELDSHTFRMFMSGNDSVGSFLDIHGKYGFLAQRDVIRLPKGPKDGDAQPYVQITHKRAMKLSEYLNEHGGEEYYRQELSRRVGRAVKDNETIIIFEFKRTYEWKFDPDKRLRIE
jgi:hypothetical protein